MANLETKKLDEIITSRRAMIAAGTAFATLFLAPKAKAVVVPTVYSDTDILNFALSTEYLGANYYYLAAFGIPINAAQNASSKAAGAAVIGVTGTGAAVGSVMVKSNPQVPFTTLSASSYAVQAALDEGHHVTFLRNALGALAVAQPQIDLINSFNTLAQLAGIGNSFDPFANDVNFLLGAYIFEENDVFAYHGAAPLISTTVTGKTYLAAAASIYANEAYHAGFLRAAINATDPNNTAGLLTQTQQISALRAKLSLAANGGKNNAGTTTPDDLGLTNTNSVTLDNGATVNATQLVNADSNIVAFSRNTTQALAVATGGGTATTPAKGGFFPSGINGLFQ